MHHGITSFDTANQRISAAQNSAILLAIQISGNKYIVQIQIFLGKYTEFQNEFRKIPTLHL